MAVNNGLFRYSQRRKDDPLAPVAPYKVTSGDKPYQTTANGSGMPASAAGNTPVTVYGADLPVKPYNGQPYQTTITGGAAVPSGGKPTNNLLGKYSLSGDGSAGNAVPGDQVETEQTTVTPTVTPTAPADKMTVFNELYKQYFGTDFDWATATGAMPERPEGMSDDDWNTYLQRFNEGWNQYLTTGGGTGDGGTGDGGTGDGGTGDGGTGDSTVIPKGGYQATSFEDWWSYNNNGAAFDWETGSMGEKPEWMSQADWNYGVALYNAAKANREQQDVVKGDYDADTERLSSEHGAALEQEKANAQRQLQLGGGVYEKLQKYLPIQLRAQGLGNLGISQSAMVRSHANMANFMGDVENQSANRKLQLYLDYSGKQGQLDSEYRASKAALDKELQEAYGDAWEAYEAAFAPIDNLEMYVAQGEYEYTPEQLTALYADVAALSPEAKAEVDALLSQYTSNYYLNEISGSMDMNNSPDEVQALIDKHTDKMDADDLAEAKELLAKYSSDYYTNKIYDAIASDMLPEDVQAMIDQYVAAGYIDETDKEALEQALDDWAKGQINKRMSSAAELEQAIKQFGNYLTEPERTYYNNELTAMKDEEKRAHGDSIIYGALSNEYALISDLEKVREKFTNGELVANQDMLDLLDEQIAALYDDPVARKANDDAKYAAGESERVLSGEVPVPVTGNLTVGETNGVYRIVTVNNAPYEAVIDQTFKDIAADAEIYDVNDPNIQNGTTIKIYSPVSNEELLKNLQLDGYYFSKYQPGDIRYMWDIDARPYESIDEAMEHLDFSTVREFFAWYKKANLGRAFAGSEKYKYATYYDGKWYVSEKVD